mmetsp:Transcript_27463/g.50679  ORF Transcript_27463/g.50679 Transcript_27463/m.50679 type:complete len:279 (-) Transcript_27463:398-1234(-)
MQRVDELFIIAGAQRGHDQTLGFTTGEQRRTVCPGQQTRLAHDVADLVGLTTVDAGAGFDHVAAQDGGLKALHRGTKVGIARLLFGQSLDNRGAGGGHSRRALLLVRDRESGAHLLFTSGFDGCGQVRVVRSLEIKRLFRGIFGEADDQVDHGLELLVGKLHRTQHFGLGQLVCFGFDHHHGVFGAGHNQIETLFRIQAQVLHVVDGGVQDVFAILKPNAAGTDGPHEGRAGNGQGRRGGNHRNHVGVVDQIVAQHGTHHQHFVLEAGDEQGPDRTVD